MSAEQRGGWQHAGRLGKDTGTGCWHWLGLRSAISVAAWPAHSLGSVCPSGNALCQSQPGLIFAFLWQVECKKAQPKEVMSPTGSARGRSRVMPYGMDAFMLGIGMLGKLQDGSRPQLPVVPGSSLEVLFCEHFLAR